MQAYREAFQPSDDVALIVHSSYGDRFWEQQLQESMRNSSQPALLFFQVHSELLQHRNCSAVGLAEKVTKLWLPPCQELVQIPQAVCMP